MKIQFTRHAVRRFNKRKILEHEVTETIQHPEKIIKKYGLYYFRKRLDRGWIEVCCEKTLKHIKVISVYWL